MSIPDFTRKSNAISKDRFLHLELAESRINDHKLMMDSVTVLLIDSPKLVLYAVVAQHAKRYYHSIAYATPSGGETGGVYLQGRGIKEKEDALRQALIEAQANPYIMQHEGNRIRIAAALDNLTCPKSIQLTLSFD